MALSPFKTKYEQMPAYKDVKIHLLRSLKDGGLKKILDDGPFDNIGKTAQSGRANALLQMSKRAPDPILDGEEVPVLVWDGDGPPPKVYDKRISQWVSPPKMTDHYREVMAAFVSQRNATAIKAKADADARLKASETGFDSMIAAMAARLAPPPVSTQGSRKSAEKAAPPVGAV